MPARSLPTSPTTFIGRQREREQLLELTGGSARLVTLTGAGGIGKTRLAFEVAAELERDGRFRDGVAFVELAPVRDPERVVQAVAESLGVYEEGGRPIASVMLDALRTRNQLLVL